MLCCHVCMLSVVCVSVCVRVHACVSVVCGDGWVWCLLTLRGYVCMICTGDNLCCPNLTKVGKQCVSFVRASYLSDCLVLNQHICQLNMWALPGV